MLRTFIVEIPPVGLYLAASCLSAGRTRRHPKPCLNNRAEHEPEPCAVCLLAQAMESLFCSFQICFVQTRSQSDIRKFRDTALLPRAKAAAIPENSSGRQLVYRMDSVLDSLKSVC